MALRIDHFVDGHADFPDHLLEMMPNKIDLMKIMGDINGGEESPLPNSDILFEWDEAIIAGINSVMADIGMKEGGDYIIDAYDDHMEVTITSSNLVGSEKLNQIGFTALADQMPITTGSTKFGPKPI